MSRYYFHQGTNYCQIEKKYNKGWQSCRSNYLMYLKHEKVIKKCFIIDFKILCKI